MGEVKNTRKDKVLFALVIAGLVVALLLTFVILPMMQDRQSDQEETTAAPSAEAPPVQDTESEPPSPSPSPTKTYTGTDAEHDIEGGDAGFTATTDREPESGDADAAKAVIQEVVPRWAGIDLTGQGIAPDTWAKDVARPGGVNSSFTAWSQTRFYDLWGGVIQMEASANVLDVKVDKELWNVGSHSMWRVSVTRSITSDDSGDEVARETVSWDILVAQDEEGEDGPVLAYFAKPNKAHEKPETFYLPPLPKN